MSDVAEPTHGQPRTVQEYIEERPMWSDGTRLAYVPMTKMQWRIWILAAAGKFFLGFVVFMTGVALPLIARQFETTPTQNGMVAAASLCGILIGAVGLGSLSDRFGRKSMFVLEMILFTAFLTATVFCTTIPSLLVSLFGLGLALGCDYPTAHMIISENIPSANRGRLVLGAFAFNAVGALAGATVGYMVLVAVPNLNAWRWMFAIAVIPALVVTAGRFYITESANWLHARGAVDRATRATQRLLVRAPQYPQDVLLTVKDTNGNHKSAPFLALFTSHHLRATFLASVPWFLKDVSTYGIGIFTPTILAAAIGDGAHVRSMSDLIANTMLAARGDAVLSVLLIIGIVFAVMFTDKVGRIRLQIIGFIGCAAGLLVASFSVDFNGQKELFFIFAGFMLFNFMSNLGPTAQSYLLAGEVFPTSIRGTGAGFAAAFAKIGAIIAAFLFPIVLDQIGTRLLLRGLILTSLLGAVVTWFFRIETAGINLDHIGKQQLVISGPQEPETACAGNP